MCVHVFIGMSAHTYIEYLRLFCVSKKIKVMINQLENLLKKRVCKVLMETNISTLSSVSFFFSNGKDLYCTNKYSTNPFYNKDLGDFTNYTESTTKVPTLHRRTPSPTTPPSQAGDATDDAGKKTICHHRSTAPRLGIAATVDAMDQPQHT
jgi:hypothetical protein